MSRRTGSVRSSSTVDAEVANLFKLQNKNEFTNALLALRQRYRDEDLVNKIQEVFVQRHSAIVKSAKKFSQAVKTKYASQNVPFHHLLLKARAHAKKHHLSEAEFAEFQRIYEQELAGSNSSEVLIPVTNMMKVLGNIAPGTDNYFHVDEADYRNLQEILKLHESSKPLHAQTLLQGIQYNEFAPEAMNCDFSKNFHNPADYVHPVVAALFLPKFSVVDTHFLFSNISGIVKSRYNRKPIDNRPNYEVFYSLVTDPNDVVCDTRTPVGDLLHRCNLQNQLWNSVLHLRNGQHWSPSLREFMTSVDVCRLNKYDNPDLVYGRHDGTIIKRLFAAFSFRPTVVATIPLTNIFAYNPYSQSLRPTVTSIPMINVRALPASYIAPGGPAGKSTLEQALIQQQQFIEGNMIVQRMTSVLYSRQVLVFYVDRRAIRIGLGMSPFNVMRLPTSVAGFERINNVQVTYEPAIHVPTTSTEPRDEFTLASVVCALTNKDVDPKDIGQYVVGSKTYLFDPTGNVHCYSPSEYKTMNHNNNSIFNCTSMDIKDDIETKGLIFVYRSKNEGKVPSAVELS
jgi:hypothetical protein